MKINRVLASVLAVLITANNMSFITSFADNEENDVIKNESLDKKTLEISNEDLLSFIPDKKEYDGKTTGIIEAALDDMTEDGDDVKLVISVVYSGVNVSDESVAVSVRSIKLSGDDAEKYELSGFDTGDLHKEITIVPKKLKVKLKNTIYYLGSSELNSFDPDKVEYTIEKGVDGRTVKDVTPVLSVSGFEKKLGKYDSFELKNESKNKNYEPELEGNQVITVAHPEISKVQSEFVDYHTLNEYGVIGSSVKIKLHIDTYSKTDTEFSILFSGEKYSVEKKADECTAVNGGKFRYTAEFLLKADKGMTYKGDVLASVSNDYCKIEDQKLIASYNDGRSVREISNVIVDNAEPVNTTDCILRYNNHERYFETEMTVKDQSSGISKIEYCVDNDGKWHTYGENGDYRYEENGTHQRFSYSYAPDQNVGVKIKVPYMFSYKVEGDNHNIAFKVYDCAGVCHIVSTNGNQQGGYDQTPPGIVSSAIISEADNDALNTYNKAKAADPDAELKAPEVRQLEEIVNIRKYGTYFKEPFVVQVEAKDSSTSGYFSGLKRIEMIENGSSADGKSTDFGQKNTDDTYKAEFVYKTADTHSLSVKLYDYGAQEALFNAVDLFSTESCKLISDNFVYEDNAPGISFDFREKISDHDGKVWYGKNGGNAVINITDQCDGIVSGLGSVTVLLDGKKYKELDFAENKTDSVQIAIDTLKLDSGTHTITVNAVDNCGNPAIEKKAEIRVDHSTIVPEITPDTEPMIINDQNWYLDQDVVTFRTSVVSEYSVVTSIDIYCNNQKLNDEPLEVFADKDGKTYYVELKKNIKDICDYKHKTEIYAVAKTNTMNHGNSEKYTYHGDMGVPFIKKISVERKDGILEKYFPHLGVFSHEDIRFRVEVDDREFDSGIKGVTVTYYDNGEKKTVKMKKDGESYIADFPLGTNVFQSHILIKAEDNVGRIGTDFPNTGNTEKSDSVKNDVFTMIEDIPPENDIILTDGDGKKRTDSQIWYRTNKELTVTASDADSGIYQVNITVNGKEVDSDKNGVKIPDAEFINSQKALCTDEQKYVFDTDTLVETAGEAEDGKYSVRVETFDLAGNVSKTVEKSFYIDKHEPVISEFVFAPSTEDDIERTDNFVEVLEYGFYFKSDFDVKVKAADAVPSSGYDEVKYRFIPYDNGEAGEIIEGSVQMNKDGEAVIKVPAGFKGQIAAKAFDMTGNESVEKYPEAFVADDVKPEIVIEDPGDSSHHDADGNALFTEDKNVRVTITDLKSGLRSFGYSVSAEAHPIDEIITNIDNGGHAIGDIIDGWEVTGVDQNLVTSVTRVIDFTSDDNGIAVNVIANDRSNNSTDWKTGQRFTIDKTAPVVNVSMSGGADSNYYSETQKATIDVVIKERNFSSELFRTEIENSYTGAVPAVSFTPTGNPDEYAASITFPEGDFRFRLSGEDLAGHQADIRSGDVSASSYSNSFVVDYTKPVAETNFTDFGKEGDGNYYNRKKIANLTVREHNFDPGLMNLRIRTKSSGSSHELTDMYDSYFTAFSSEGWQTSDSDPDVHTLKLEFADDGVYVIDIAPSDRSGNTGEYANTAIFEMDCTAPVIAARNGQAVEAGSAEFMDVYGYDRRDEEIPFIDFTDLNFDHLKYEYVRYTPSYKSGKEIGRIEPEIIKESQKDARFVLNGFDMDGVYAVKITAVDKAGNESIVNSNTYMRMVDTDVLAYIEESDPSQKTGWYSIEDKSGPISKRPDSFKDLSIVVLSKKGANNHVVLLDENEKETDTGIKASDEQDMYGVSMYRYVLPSGYFKENYAEDADTMLYLRVNSDKEHIDLGRIHIDNIAPHCNVPDHFKNWGWYAGSGEKTIKFSNITEILDPENCIAYVTHKGVTKEVKMDYDPSDNSASITLGPGKYSVGVSLADRAGNKYTIPEISHLAIGNYRIWLAVASAAGLALAVAAAIFITNMVKRRRLR